LWAPRTAWLETLIHSFEGLLWAIFNRPDVLHVHAIGPALIAPIARLFGLRVVVTHHGFDYDRERWGAFAKRVLRLGESLGMRFANERIVISREIQKHVRDSFNVKSNLIPNGVRLPSPPVSTETLCKLGLVPGRYVVQVSRCVPEKRQLDLIEAFTKAAPPGWKLALVGSLKDGDPYCEAIRAKAASRSDIVLAGFRSGEELNQLYSHAGLFVLPSSHEGLPIALLEGLSYGLPVLVSGIPSNREVGLPDECYFTLGDIDGLASRIREKTDAPKESPEAADDRRELVARNYDWRRIAMGTLEVLRRAAAT
jgi:glycosyltransferase involved in cell wall biosynthesis